VIVGVLLSGASLKDRWKDFLYLHSGCSQGRWLLLKTLKGTGTGFSSRGQYLGQVMDKKPGKEGVGTEVCVGMGLFKASAYAWELRRATCKQRVRPKLSKGLRRL